MDQTNEPVEEAPPEREVHIVMTPVKDIGPTRKLLVKILMHTLGSIAAAGWCMHWVILAEDTCFELQRYSTRPYTRLRASRWDGSRSSQVLQQMEIGRTSWKNADIEDLGQSLDS